MKFLFKILVLFLLYQPVKSWAVARNPFIGNETLSPLYGDVDLTLNKLKIHFIADESGKKGHLKYQYFITSEEEKNIFLFTLEDLKFHKLYIPTQQGKTTIKINGEKVDITYFDGKKLPSFMEMKITLKDSLSTEKDTLFYFKDEKNKWGRRPYEIQGCYASLHKGVNIVEVEWTDYMLGYRKDQFISNLWFNIDTNSLNYWQKVEAIEIIMAYNRQKTEFVESNFGMPIITNNELKWHFNQIPKDEIRITLKETRSRFVKILVTINPFGFGFISFLILAIYHLRLILKVNAKRRFLWLGIVLVPIISYIVLFSSFSFIEWILEKNVYNDLALFAIITYPLLQVAYLVVMVCLFYLRKKEIM